MNLAVNGLRGEIKKGNSYYEDLVDSYGKLWPFFSVRIPSIAT
jgi:hypothetical protein